LRVTEEDIASLTWKQAAILTYLRSHAPGFILSAARIGKRFALHPQTVQTILRPLVGRKLVMLVRERNERGSFGRGGYSVSPHTKMPETVSPDTVKPGTHQGITHTPLSQNKLSPQVPPSASPEESIRPPPGAAAHVLFSSGGKGASTYKARKAAKERRNIEKLYERTGIEEPFTAPATHAEAIRHVAADLRAKAKAGVEIYGEGDSNRLVEVEFFDNIGLAEIAETGRISDIAVREGIKRATGGRVKEVLLGKEGLLTVRRLVARIMQDDVPARDAFEALLTQIERATKGRWLNSWDLIARRLAGELYSYGAERLLQHAGALAEEFKRRDWNGVLALELFTSQGVAGLRCLIATHGADAVKEAVLEYLARSKWDRAIRPGHVRRWAYFERYIREQTGEAI
jgi:hypothetical protein